MAGKPTHLAGMKVEYTADQLEFMNAMHAYKRTRQRMFPAWSEVLAVLQSLGYRKVAPATDLPRAPVEEGKCSRS